MDKKYSKAYVEVLALLKCLPEDEYSKIPIEKIQFYEEKKDKNYIFSINPNIELEKQNISKEANAIIISLFMEYFATEDQNKKINALLIQNEKNNSKI